MSTTEFISPETSFEILGLSLPPAPLPLGVYKPYLIDGKYLYLSGHGPVNDDKSLIIGRIGKDLDIEAGKLAARQVGLTMLSTIKTHLGSLNTNNGGTSGATYIAFNHQNALRQFEQSKASN